jgi:hypothetical protein
MRFNLLGVSGCKAGCTAPGHPSGEVSVSVQVTQVPVVFAILQCVITTSRAIKEDLDDGSMAQSSNTHS